MVMNGSMVMPGNSFPSIFSLKMISIDVGEIKNIVSISGNSKS
jgi:hypothetical protein